MPEPETKVSQSAALDGYIALLFSVLTFAGPLASHLARLPDAFGIIWLLTWPLALLFAISGIRRGRGGAQVAAWLAMIIFVWYTATTLLIAYH